MALTATFILQVTSPGERVALLLAVPQAMESWVGPGNVLQVMESWAGPGNVLQVMESWVGPGNKAGERVLV